MKKSLLGLLTATITFFCGILPVKIFLFEQKPVLDVPVVEIKIPQAPVITSESFEIEEEISVEKKLENQTIYGWYWLEGIHEGMSGANTIALYRDIELNDDGTRVEKITSSAGVFTLLENYGDQGYFESAWAEITDKKAKFRTKKIKGIEYRFEGIFFKNKTSGVDGEKVLRGTLKKFVKGKKVAEITGEFAYAEPHCWH